MNAMQSPGTVVADSRIAQIASGVGWVLAALGLAALAGSAFHMPQLVRIVPGLATMKANIALAFLLSGVALLRRGSRDFRLYGLGVLLIGAATLMEYLSGFDLGIDQLLFHDPASTIDPGRMSHISAAGFCILGPGLLLMNAQSPWGRRLSRILGLISGTIGFIALLGYSYDTSALYQIRPHASVAVHTALGLVAAGIALQCVHPREGIARQIHADSAGGAAAVVSERAADSFPARIDGVVWPRAHGVGDGICHGRGSRGHYVLSGDYHAAQRQPPGA